MNRILFAAGLLAAAAISLILIRTLGRQQSDTNAKLGHVVCLDPGHADTPWEIDPETGLNTMDWINGPEIGIVFDIALRTKALLEADGVRVILTKNTVYEKVNLKQREEIANSAGAALILHIHTDPALRAPTTFYPGGPPHNWRANSQSGRTVFIDAVVQQESERSAKIFHAEMSAMLRRLAGSPPGACLRADRGATPAGNYGPLYTFNIWSNVPTILIENNQAFADTHRQEIAQSLAAGIMACLSQGEY